MQRVLRLGGLPPYVARERVAAVALGVAWLLPWMTALHAGQATWLPPVVGCIFMLPAVVSGVTKWTVLTGIVVLTLGFIFGRTVGVLAIAVAIAIGWSTRNMLPRIGLVKRLIVMLVGMSALVIWHPTWWPVLVAELGFGVGVVAVANHPVGAPRGAWSGLAIGVVMISLGLALIALVAGNQVHIQYPGGVPRILPGSDQPLPRLRGHGHGPFGNPGSGILRGFINGQTGLGHARSPHFPGWIMIVAGGLILVVVGVWCGRRAQRSLDVEPSPTDKPKILDRKPVDKGSTARLAILSPTRRWARYLLGRTRQAANYMPAETFREWALRTYGSGASRAATLYEEVRYGAMDDSPTRAADAEQIVVQTRKSNHRDRAHGPRC